jgi:hypothetical protein
MANLLFALSVVLVGQLNDRYFDTNGQSASGPTNNSQDPGAGSGVVPILETAPAATGVPPGASQPAETTTDPYGSATAPIGGSSRIDNAEGLGANRAGDRPVGYGEFPARQGSTSGPVSPASPGTQNAGAKPSTVMRTMLAPPAGAQLSGQQVTLAEVVAGGPSRAEQTLRVEAYWDLCSSVADYYLGLREQQELRQLRNMVPQAGAAFQQAETELAVRVNTSQRAALASQIRLGSFMGRGPGSLPLPGDLPHCGNYQSYYEEIFAGRPSLEAQELSALLPLRFAELKDAAAAVLRAEEFMRAVVENRNANSDGTGPIRALELLALRRRAFVQIARDYNRRIARYVELATPGEIGSERLIGMLIMRSGTSTATRSSTAPPPLNRQSRAAAAPPPSTFADGWTPPIGGQTTSSIRDEAVTPAAANSETGPLKERSLLVKP